MSSVSYSCSSSVTCRSTGSGEDLDPGAQLVVLDLVGGRGQEVHAADGLVQVAVGLHGRAGERAGDVVEVQIEPVLLSAGAGLRFGTGKTTGKKTVINFL